MNEAASGGHKALGHKGLQKDVFLIGCSAVTTQGKKLVDETCAFVPPHNHVVELGLVDTGEFVPRRVH